MLFLDLNLNVFGQSGDLAWLSHISSLRFLNLSLVDLGAAIHLSQAINKLPSLIHLNLNGCALLPFTTGSLFHANSSASLVFLDLSNNYLINSSIYPWLFKFSTTLVHLDRSSNDLNGSILDAFGNMIALAYLDLIYCFECEIPFSFGDMIAIEYLDISGHGLHSEILDTFKNMTSLTYLALSSNQPQGGIPNAIGDLTSLTYLELFGNQLKAIPKTFSRSLVHVDIF